jgi:hypothetical protein
MNMMISYQELVRTFPKYKTYERPYWAFSARGLISFICEGKRGDRRIEELQFIPYVQRTHPEVLTFQEWISPVD